MASSYSVLTYGNARLREPSRPVKTVDATIRALARDLLDTMYENKGLGLAAEQIGRTEAICVIDVPPLKDKDGKVIPPENPGVVMPIVLINPDIIAQDGSETTDEGCLSFPDIYVRIKRAARVTVTYLDLDGHKQTLKAAGLLARAVQHEVDHLHGRLLVDRMSSLQKISVAGKLKRLKKAAKEESPA